MASKRLGIKTSVKISSIAVLVAVLACGLGLLKTAHAFPTNATIQDDFNRADTPSVSWTGSQQTSGSYQWSGQSINSSGSSTLGVSSNQMFQSNVNNDNAYLDHVFGPDSEVSADVPVLPDDGSYIALWARVQNPGSNSYSSYALVYIHSDTSSVWALRRYDNATPHQLGTSSFNTSPISAGDSIGLSVTGTGSTVRLSAYQKTGGVWSLIGSADDTDANRITSAGYVGVELGDPNVRIDNFSGGDVIQNSTPSAPALSAPADNASGVSTSPQFRLRSTDTDSDDLRYKIEICSDAACSTVLRTIDQTNSQTGWSGQDQQSNTAYTGGSNLPSSALATYDYQLPVLDNNTRYWWRAYAIDPNGTNAFSLASSIFSFTTQAAAQSGSGNSGSGPGANNSGNPATLDVDYTPPSYTKWGK